MRTAFRSPQRRPARPFIGLILAAAMLTGLPSPAAAEKAAELEAAEFLLAFFDDFNAYLRNDSMSGEVRLAEFRRLLNKGFHLKSISKYVLDEHWEGTSDGQQNALQAAIEDFIIVTYGKYVPEMKPMELKIVATRQKEDDLVQLRSNVNYVPDTGEKFIVDYALRREDAEWGIVNIRVQGFTPTAIHRSEFTSFANNNGVDALLEELKSKNQKLSPATIGAAN